MLREKPTVTPELQSFLKAYIAALHKRFIFALEQDEKSKTEADMAFFDGAIFCYQDVLKILTDQLKEQGYDPESLEPIMIEAEQKRSPIPPPADSSDQDML
ncbi:MAG: hypothetical protein AAGA75_21835 [Cyanobacteria bacterium P01_E01_bin.6]